MNGGVRTAWVQGKGRERKGKQGKEGKEGKGRERKGKEGKRKGKEGKARERNEWEKKPLEISELGCVDGCGRRGCNRGAGNGWGEKAAGDERAWLRLRMGAENCADGCGRRGCKGVAGNGWGEEAAGDQRAWLLRTAADGKWVGRIARTAADGVGARELLEMGGEKKPLEISELGCADGCGREMGAENCATAAEWLEMGAWGEEAAGERAWPAADARCNGVAGNWWGAKVMSELGCADMRGRLRTANGWGELRGRLRTAWVPGSGWKWVGRRSRWRSASLAARTAADGKWVRRIARTAADGVGAREWLEMGGEKKPLEISELGCADGCGGEMGAENCADGCGRRGCKGVAGNGWGEEAAGDERAWLRGRLRTG